MKRKIGEGGLDEAVNMDVMMDNMTDVVGTLLMVLIIVQLQVNNAVDTIQSNLPEVTQEQVAAKQAELEELKIREEETKEAAETDEQASETLVVEVARKRAELRRFETTDKQDAATLMSLEKVQSELEARRREVELEKAAVAKLVAERDRLAGLLDQAKPMEGPADKIVRIPESRDIPQGAVLFDVLCKADHLYVADFEPFEKKTIAALASKQRLLMHSTTKDAQGRDIPVFDQEKTIEFLNERSLGSLLFEVRFPLIKTQTVLRIELHPTQKAADEPLKPGSAYLKLVNRLKKTGGVVWFRVMPDAFETYIAAREVCDKLGVPAGWEMTSTPFFLKAMPEVRVNQLEKPSAPPQKPADGIVIPSPKRTLD